MAAQVIQFPVKYGPIQEKKPVLATLTYDTFVGDKYDRNVRVKDIAKIFREEVKAAVKAGTIPKIKLSVTSDWNSVNVRIVDVPADFVIPNKARVEWEIENPHACIMDAPSEFRWIYSDAARDLISKLEAMLNAYNFEKSCRQTDDRDLHFYDNVSFGPVYAQQRKAMIEAIKSKAVV